MPPDIDASGAAAQAMEMFDADGDGYLNSAELPHSPGLRASMKTLDANTDSMVTEDEIAARIRAWQATQAGLTAIRCYVTIDGQPLAGGTVTFEPEPFLADYLQTATGKTTPDGVASPSIPKDKRPSPNMPPGLQLGFYRVRFSRIVNGRETVPAKFNAETTVGQEISPDDPAILRQRVAFDLKSD